MLSKLMRIGKDAELRHTPQGKEVIGLYCVYDVGYGDKKKPQWIEVVIWGKQADALAPYLLKGKQVVIHADDVAIEEYQKNDGTTSTKLKCRAVNVELAGSKQEGGQANQQQAPQQNQGYQQQAPQPQYQPQTQQQAQQQYQNQPNPANHQPMQGYVPQEPGFADGDSEDVPF